MQYSIGIFGRLSGRVFLLYKGTLDLPSDLAGVVYIDISNGVNAAGETLRREIANVT
jgi:predicted nucleotide-binding protein